MEGPEPMKIRSTSTSIKRVSPRQWELRFCLVADEGEVDGYWVIEPPAGVDLDDGFAERFISRNREKLFGLGVFTAQEDHPEDAGGYLYIPESTTSPDAAVGMLRSVSLLIRYSPRTSDEASGYLPALMPSAQARQSCGVAYTATDRRSGTALRANESEDGMIEMECELEKSSLISAPTS